MGYPGRIAGGVIVAFLLMTTVPVAQKFPAGKTAYLPAVRAVPKPQKCVAGGVTAEQLAEVGAVCSQHWSPCWNEPGCVHAWKDANESEEWLTAEAITETAAECGDCYMLFGNEPNLAGKSIAEQCKMFKWFVDAAHSGSPDVRILFGGVLVDYPQQAGFHYGWPAAFWAECREYLDTIAGVHIHAYWWSTDDPWKYVAKIDHMAAQIRAVCPDCEVWVTEAGSLVSQEYARQAMAVLPAANVDRVFWFVSESLEWRHVCSLWDGGELTELGELYRGEW